METGPNPAGRGKAGTKRHLVVDGEGTPSGLTISAVNRQDSRMLAPTLDAIPPVRGRRGRPRRRPAICAPTRCMIIAAAAANAAPAASPGRRQGRRAARPPPVEIERALAWPARFRRLAVRHERRADVHLVLTTLACAVVCVRQVKRFCP